MKADVIGVTNVVKFDSADLYGVKPVPTIVDAKPSRLQHNPLIVIYVDSKKQGKLRSVTRIDIDENLS